MQRMFLRQRMDLKNIHAWCCLESTRLLSGLCSKGLMPVRRRGQLFVPTHHERCLVFLCALLSLWSVYLGPSVWNMFDAPTSIWDLSILSYLRVLVYQGDDCATGAA